MAETQYNFVTEWYDQQADIVRTYQLSYFSVHANSEHDAVSMFDPKKRRMFLKRMLVKNVAKGVSVKDLFIGSFVTVNCRRLQIVKYMDPQTEAALAPARKERVVCTSPADFASAGSILTALSKTGSVIAGVRIVDDSGPVIALRLVGKEEQLPVGLSQTDKNYFDGNQYPTTATFDNCSLLVIKPHAVKNGDYGAILSAVVAAGFEISAMKSATLTKAEASELLEVYEGVVSSYSGMVDAMVEGIAIFVEVRAPGVIQKLRELCGPADPELGRVVRKSSLRALYGDRKSVV